MSCKTCAKWEQGEPNLETGECLLAINEGNDSRHTDSMISWDYEGYKSGLTTHKDFWCKSWAPKKEQDNG